MATDRRPLIADRRRPGIALLLALAVVVPGLACLIVATPMVWRPHWPGWNLLLVGVVGAPIVEELVFRGGLQEWLIGRGWGRTVRGFTPSGANLATSLVFALAHLVHHSPLWAAAIFFPSLILGALYERQRRLAAPMLVHGAYNAAYLILLAVA